MLWGMTVRSPAPRGRVKEIRFGIGVDWKQFTVVDHRDLPGPNEVYLIERDQPVLAGTYVRHVHEAVLLIAGEDREMVRRAVAAVEVVIEREEPALNFRVAPTSAQLQGGYPENILKHLTINKGDVESALRGSPIVVEGVYETGAQEHVYIECNGMIGWVDAAGVVCVKGSMQCPYYVLNALKHTFQRDEKGVRVIQAATGGGFGGKEDYPSVLALHAALLAMKSGRPVKMIYDRGEDMQATTKRHPCVVRHRTGVDRDGRLLAQDIEVRMDAGAYITLSPVVLSRGIIHAAGPYFCEHVRIDGKAVLTNSVPYGAFRGFGAPQTIFGVERHMDSIAARLGMDPSQVRRINLLRDGQTTATGQVIRAHAPSKGTDRVALMERALDMGNWTERKREHGEFNARVSHSSYLRRGIGLATFWHGAGFTGSGETYLKSKVQVAALADGRVEVRIASTEMGQGTTTIMVQIVAERLGISTNDVVVAVPDTFVVPNSGPTVASRTAMVVGRLVERACDDLQARRGMGLPAHVSGASAEADASNPSAGGPPYNEIIGEATYEAPPGIQWDDNTYKGDAYGTFGWGAYVAEVEVDLRTYATRVTDFVAVQEVGSVINPVLAAGQVQGGVVQAIGWALMEECVWKDGAMANSQLTNYIIPTSDDVPPIRVEFVENPYPYGGKGSKGIGELPMDGPGPAIANAIADALKDIGVEPNRLPITPEHLMECIERAEDSHA